MQTFKKYWLPVVLWCVLIFGFSSIPQARIAPQMFWDFVIRKLAHFTEYAILYAFSYRASKSKLTSILFVLSYAMTDEIHQLYVPGREGSVRDVIIDSAGGLFALLVLWKYSQILPVKLKTWVNG